MRLYTVSKLNEWNQCQLKYFAHHLEKINWKEERSGSSIQLILGNLIHKFFEKFYAKTDTALKFKHKIISLEEWKNSFIKAWEEEMQIYEFIPEIDSKINLEKGLICLQNFYEREKNRDFKPPLLIEHKFTIVLNGLFKLTGKIDRIDEEPDGSITIIDYKISDNIKTLSDAEQDTQLAVYAFACEQNILGRKANSIGWYYPLKNLNIFAEPQIQKQEEILSEILSIDGLIEVRQQDQKLYPSSPRTGYCDYCGYKHKCPEHNSNVLIEDFNEIEISNMIEEATSLHAQIKPLEKRLEELKNQIKEFMLQKEINKIANISLQKQERGEYSAQALWNILKQLDNGHELVDIRKSALKECLPAFTLNEQKIINSAYMSKQINMLKINQNK